MTIALTQTERRAIGLLSGIYALRMLGLFMVLPVFSIYAKQLNDVTPLRVGVALGIYGLTQALFQIPFGFLSDRWGRKPVIMVGLCLFAIGSAIAACSTSILGIIAGRGLQGLGAVGSVIMALLADMTREQVRLRAMAMIGMAIGFSFILAFVVGPCVYTWVGVRGIFWITACLALGASGLVMIAIPTPIKGEPIRLLRNRRLLPVKTGSVLYGGVLILHASLTALFLKIPEAIVAFEQIGGQMWRFYLPVFTVAVLLTLPIIFYLESSAYFKFGLKATVLCLALSELGILVFFHSFWGMSVSLCLFFTAFNVLESSLPALISRSVAPSHKGAALGIFSALQFLGLFLGGVIGGVLDSWNSSVAVLGFCVILAVIWSGWIFYSFD